MHAISCVYINFLFALLIYRLNTELEQTMKALDECKNQQERYSPPYDDHIPRCSEILVFGFILQA